MTVLSLILADDHELVRAGLKQTLCAEADLRVTAECRLGREVLPALAAHACDILLLDISLPDISGLDVLSQVRRHHERVQVLILSAHPEVQFGLNVIRAGASGFVSKSGDSAELLRAIRTVARGNRYVGAELGDLLVKGLTDGSEGPRHGSLSEREFQIFCKIAEGMTVTGIAQQLFLSVKTISTYRTRILEKMDLRTNADITSYAIKNQLVP